jgi:hypothetical protein
MSWQRIDENTYIDDTLVTCAEYQLFIDDMHEQGKHYQPDHWTSYQFSTGQAREPILGVRHSDVVAFCEWLTGRENNDWKYRLPDQAEVKTSSIKAVGKYPLGYWFGVSGQSALAWIGPIPSNPREIMIADLPWLNVGPTFIHSDAAIRYDDIRRELDNNRYNNPTLDQAIGKILNNARLRPLDLDWVAGYSSNLERVRDRSLDHVYVSHHIILPVFHLDLALEAVSALDRAIEGESDSILDLTFYIDICTLQQRIAGRSPAFEGIRLVKERK